MVILRRAVHADREWLDSIRHTRIIPAVSTPCHTLAVPDAEDQDGLVLVGPAVAHGRAV
jgi:hypothetical protein